MAAPLALNSTALAFLAGNLMKEIVGVSSETGRLTKEYLRRLSITDSLPESAQAMAEFELKKSNEILAAVINQIKREPIFVALQKGKWQSIDFRSDDTPLTAEVVENARAALNSLGYSLLVVKASQNLYKLLVAKHSAVSKPQSRLLWVAPNTVSSVISLAWKRTWEKARQKLHSALVEDKRSHQGNRSLSNQFNSKQRDSRQRSGKTAPSNNWRNHRDDCEIFPLEALSVGKYAYTIPWGLDRNDDGTYWFSDRLICSKSPGGTAVMKIHRTEEGVQGLLPKNFDYHTVIKGHKYECFRYEVCQNFEWVPIGSRMPRD